MNHEHPLLRRQSPHPPHLLPRLPPSTSSTSILPSTPTAPTMSSSKTNPGAIPKPRSPPSRIAGTGVRSTEVSLPQNSCKEATVRIASVLSSLIESLGRTNQMCAYLIMMAARLIELHRVLKSTGSIYLHCDDTASHYHQTHHGYVIFGPQWNFRNEIMSGNAPSSHNLDPKRFGLYLHDTIILIYTNLIEIYAGTSLSTHLIR